MPTLLLISHPKMLKKQFDSFLTNSEGIPFTGGYLQGEGRGEEEIIKCIAIFHSPLSITNRRIKP